MGPQNTSPHLRNLLRSPSLEPLSTPDYTVRRHSIHHPHGLKRKVSSDPPIFAPVGEEPDPRLVGPGVPSLMDLDSKPPAPKRRGSAIDTQRIAQLSLADRRGSADSRPSSSHPWWSSSARRDSSSPMLSSTGQNSVNLNLTSPDSPHNHLPSSIAAFSWSSNPDPALDPPTIPPLNYLPDRRMSVPDTLISHPKSLHPRSPRPSSRQAQPPEPDTRSTSAQDNPTPPSAPLSLPQTTTLKKDNGSTPYSRSPELRVSHKLAERKRRKEMKDLFDELRDQLPADRGIKASKWEVLTKAIDFVGQLKQSNQDMTREIEHLRREVDIARGSSVYGQQQQQSQVPVVPSQGPPPPPPLLQPPLPGPSQLPLPRLPTQNVYTSLTPSPLPNGVHSPP